VSKWKQNLNRVNDVFMENPVNPAMIFNDVTTSKKPWAFDCKEAPNTAKVTPNEATRKKHHKYSRLNSRQPNKLTDLLSSGAVDRVLTQATWSS
jgi:hypothetical protein